jgi:uncharacterized membrane protein
MGCIQSSIPIPIVNKKILIVIIIVIAAVTIPISVYTISPLFISNTINEPLPTTAVANEKEALKQYQKFVSMNEPYILTNINSSSQIHALFLLKDLCSYTRLC